MPKDECCFSTSHLSNMLAESLPRRRFLRFREFHLGESSDNICLLRHDVDVSLEYAARLAAIEQNLGIPATFFVRLRAAGYNAHSQRSRVVLRSIEEAGGEIGLHYEGAINGEGLDKAWRRFLLEKAVLEDLVGRCIGVALHTPRRCSAFAEEALREVGVLYDVSWQERFGALTFISDSNGTWHGGCLCEHLRTRAGLHALLHPAWWVAELREADVISMIRSLQDGE